jgi:hypothetical protein
MPPPGKSNKPKGPAGKIHKPRGGPNVNGPKVVEKKPPRAGDLPPRKGRDWNPGAGPRPATEDGGSGGGGGGGGEPEERLSRIWHEASAALALPAAAVRGVKELPQADADAKEATAIAALDERAAAYEKLASRAGSADSKWLKLAGPRRHAIAEPAASSSRMWNPCVLSYMPSYDAASNIRGALRGGAAGGHRGG